jgi:hypothetical protein
LLPLLRAADAFNIPDFHGEVSKGRHRGAKVSGAKQVHANRLRGDCHFAHVAPLEPD